MNIIRGNQYYIINVLIIYILKYSAHLATLYTHTHIHRHSRWRCITYCRRDQCQLQGKCCGRESVDRGRAGWKGRGQRGR